MNTGFEEGYARYLNSLAKLDTTDDIREKNALFRQLTEQLSELEKGLITQGTGSDWEDGGDDPDPTRWS